MRGRSSVAGSPCPLTVDGVVTKLTCSVGEEEEEEEDEKVGTAAAAAALAFPSLFPAALAPLSTTVPTESCFLVIDFKLVHFAADVESELAAEERVAEEEEERVVGEAAVAEKAAHASRWPPSQC